MTLCQWAAFFFYEYPKGMYRVPYHVDQEMPLTNSSLLSFLVLSKKNLFLILSFPSKNIDYTKDDDMIDSLFLAYFSILCLPLWKLWYVIQSNKAF